MADLYLSYNVPLLYGQYGDDNQRRGVDSVARYLVVGPEIKGDRVCVNTTLYVLQTWRTFRLCHRL